MIPINSSQTRARVPPERLYVTVLSTNIRNLTKGEPLIEKVFDTSWIHFKQSFDAITEALNHHLSSDAVDPFDYMSTINLA